MTRRRWMILGAIVLAVGAVVLGGIVLLWALYDGALPGQSSQVSVPESYFPDHPQAADERTLEMVSVLPRGILQAIDNPQFLSAEEANSQYLDDEMVIGVVLNGDARAYSIPELSRHEVLNDTVGGVKISVTW